MLRDKFFGNGAQSIMLALLVTIWFEAASAKRDFSSLMIINYVHIQIKSAATTVRYLPIHFIEYSEETT